MKFVYYYQIPVIFEIENNLEFDEINMALEFKDIETRKIMEENIPGIDANNISVEELEEFENF